MKTIKHKGIYGKTITMIVPENTDDIRHIRSMEKDGVIDMSASFGELHTETHSDIKKHNSKTKTGCGEKTPQLA